MAEFLRERYEEAMQGAEHLASRLPASTAPRKEGWNDELLRELRKNYKFDIGVYNRATTKLILGRFFEFYLNGTIDDSDNLVAVIADTVALSETAQGQIWPEEFNGVPESRVFYTVNQGLGRISPEEGLGRAPTLVIPETIATVADQTRYRALTTVYQQDHMRGFRQKVKTIIDRINVNEGASESERKLKRLAGFLALTLMRAATKDKNQLTNSFLKNQYRANLTALAGWGAEEPWAPPCDLCIERAVTGLVKGLPGTSALFCILANEYVAATADHYRDPHVTGYLSAAVLTHTARNGLGLVQLVDHACNILDIDWKMLLQYTYTDRTVSAWKVLTDFFRSFLVTTRMEYGYNWARIINDGYLRDLAPKENLFLAGILGGVIEPSQGPGIWQAEWAKGKEESLMAPKTFGKTLHRLLKPRLEEISAYGPSVRVLEEARRDFEAEIHPNGLAEAAVELFQ